MNHEAAFATALSGDDQEKLAAHFESYSTDELAELLKEKTAGLSERDYMRGKEGLKNLGRRAKEAVRKHGPAAGIVGGAAYLGARAGAKHDKYASVKVADAWGRELAREDIEKTAYFGGDDVLGGLIGYHAGKSQAARGEKHTFGIPQALAVGFVPGGAGYQIGRYLGHGDAAKNKGKRKRAGVALLRAEMDKAAALGPVGPAIGAALNKAGPWIGKGLKAVVGATPSQRMGYGAAGGAALGAGRYLMKGRDPQTGQRQGSLLGSMAMGAAGGTVAGLAAKPLAERVLDNRHVKDVMTGNFSPKWTHRVRGGAAAGSQGYASPPNAGARGAPYSGGMNVGGQYGSDAFTRARMGVA